MNPLGLGPFTAVVLAAGLGKRMKSDLPKVLHRALGKPLLLHVLGQLAPLHPSYTVIVVGHKEELVKEALHGRDVHYITQSPQLGTGHAVQVAWPEIEKGAEKGGDTVLILAGDMPLVRTMTVRKLIERHITDRSGVTFLSGELDDPAAKSGLSVAVTIKPGLPLGPIRQKIRLVTNLPRASVLEVPIEGAIQSDISVVGPGWKSEQGVLSLGTVSHTQGIKRTLMLLVHGPHRQDVRFSVGKVVPSLLRVQIGESRQIGSGAVVQVPLEIEIPPGSPPVSYLSASQSKLAEIVLETTHPEAKQLRLWVQFAIER
jgi:CTP:molybdopterin cytidylyltransferase MocA